MISTLVSSSFLAEINRYVLSHMYSILGQFRQNMFFTPICPHPIPSLCIRIECIHSLGSSEMLCRETISTAVTAAAESCCADPLRACQWFQAPDLLRRLSRTRSTTGVVAAVVGRVAVAGAGFEKDPEGR